MPNSSDKFFKFDLFLLYFNHRERGMAWLVDLFKTGHLEGNF